MYEAIIAKTTASAKGRKRNPPTPPSPNIGTKAMQMQNSDTVAGMTICSAPSRIDRSTAFPCSMCQLMFSIVTVASSTRIPTAKARPPSVMTLIVSPSAESAVSEARMARGIETVMISVDRQLPKKRRIIKPVSTAAITPSVMTPVTADLTKSD